jgi:hypothetical protein
MQRHYRDAGLERAHDVRHRLARNQ